MNNINLTYQDVGVYLIIINTVIGLLFGLFPLFAGLRLNNRRYGLIGLLGSTIGGALLGFLLAFPIAMICNWLILRGANPHVEETVDSVDPTSV